ncbi:MAG: glycoside hydrolase family 16 protein [Kosmotoga sp.]|nr:MAG: glycoside hydrolase family 16 protein [Kosmotoga sp.]
MSKEIIFGLSLVLFLAVYLCFVSVTSKSSQLSEPQKMINDPDWTLIWSDEFEGEEINMNNWRFDIGNRNGWGNAELQYYTEGKNVHLDNGMLVIEARREDILINDRLFNYTSSRLKTEGKFSFQYGKIEARIKFPYGKGLWPAFWMLGDNFRYVGWPMCGEIDIVEFLGHDKWTIYGTIHGPNYSGSRGIGGKFRLDQTDSQPFTEDFNTFGIIWNEKEIIWYVNDTIYHRVKRKVIEDQNKLWVFDREFFLILNLAVGGYWPGYPDFDTPFPARMYVDYVRVYQMQQ